MTTRDLVTSLNGLNLNLRTYQPQDPEVQRSNEL